MKKTIPLFIAAMLLSSSIMAQQSASRQKPAWTNGYFKELKSSTVKQFEETGRTEEEARNKALLRVIEWQTGATGLRAQVQIQNERMVVSGNDDLTVKARIIDEFRERTKAGDYRAYLLVQITRNPAYEFDNLESMLAEYKGAYPFSPRVFVPGMAQIHKGSTTKGVLFIAGEAALIGGVVVAENLRASYIAKINTTHNAADIKTCLNNADNWQNIRNGLIAGAAAIYVWNVIDGWVAKGKPRLMAGHSQWRVAPYWAHETAGFALNITF